MMNKNFLRNRVLPISIVLVPILGLFTLIAIGAMVAPQEEEEIRQVEEIQVEEISEEQKLANEEERLRRIEQREAEALEQQKQEEEQREEERKRQEEEAYQKQIEDQFSPWDGSHTKLTRLIKERLNDPKSYDHTKTTYKIEGDDILILTDFRAKNAFGGIVQSSVIGKASIDGENVEIVEWI
jgi:TolA-binding protein